MRLKDEEVTLTTMGGNSPTAGMDIVVTVTAGPTVQPTEVQADSAMTYVVRGNKVELSPIVTVSPFVLFV